MNKKEIKKQLMNTTTKAERIALLTRLWADGYFGANPLLWADKSRSIMADFSDAMAARVIYITHNLRNNRRLK